MPKEQSALGESATRVWNALPYIDVVNEAYEQYALSLMEKEMKEMKQSDRIQKVKPIPDLVLRTETLRRAYQTCVERGGDAKERTSVEPASILQPPQDDSIEAWREAVQRARIAYEMERIRSVQLDVEKEDGSFAAAELWKRYHQHVLEPQLAVLQKIQEQERWNVAQINQERQQSQRDEYQPALYRLELQHQELLQKQFTLKQAIANLEQELSLSGS